jgi:outer membrane receptor protein involved in Fe transport
MLPPHVPAPHALAALCCALTATVSAAGATAEAGKRSFNLPGGDAASTLKQFAAAAGTPIVYLVERVRGETTNAVRGEFTPRDALERMLAGSALEAAQDAATGALVVSRKRTVSETPKRTGEVGPVSDPKTKTNPTPAMPKRSLLAALAGILAFGPAAEAQTAPTNPATEVPVAMTAFEVKSEKDQGYRKTNSITTSRVGVSVLENPQAVQIISSELLSDLNVTRADDVFRYSASVTSQQGETAQGNLYQMRGFDLPRYYNGMIQANSGAIYGEFTTDNIERIEIAKGAVGLFYGNSSPNGVANYITKKAQFLERTDLTLSAGTFGYAKALVDTQNVVGEKRTLAYRIIASAAKRDERVHDQKADTLFVAPSVVYAPSAKFRLEAEYNGTKFHKPYGTIVTRNFAINPQYYTDITSPSTAILNYMKTTYGLADDAAARARITERWVTPTALAFLNNWSADKLAITGTEPFQQTGSTINWSRISPEGDKFSGVHQDSNEDGFSHFADVAVTVSPTENLAFRYHWAHQETKQNFVRMQYNPNGGLAADGRLPSLFAGFFALSLDGKRQAFSDVQQLDAAYKFDLGPVKNTITAGVERRRIVTAIAGAPANTTLTGSTTYINYNPFTQAEPSLFAVVNGSTPQPPKTIGEFEDYFVSHRGKALNGRLNTSIGYRHVKDRRLNLADSTVSYGAIYEVAKGLHAFASTSETFVLTTQNSITSTNPAAVVAADNQRRLNPESGQSWEAGVKSDLRDGVLSGSVSYFEIERQGIVKGAIDLNSLDRRNLDNDPNNDVRYFVNGGLERSRGVDTDLIWTPGNRFQAVLNFVYLSEANIINDPSVNEQIRSRATQKTYERRLAKSPEKQLSLVSKYNFTDGTLKGLSVGGAIRYNDDYQATNSAAADLVIPSETLIDLFATYSGVKVMGRPAHFQVNVTNLTNEINDLTRGNGLEVAGSVRFRF